MDLEKFFEIDSQHRILICTTCQYAIIPSQLGTNMRVRHPRLTLQQRHDFGAKVDASNDFARAHKDVIYPTSTDAPLQSLPVCFDDLRCRWASGSPSACTYVCRTLRLMREHCKQKYGWVNQQKRGGDVRAKGLHARNKNWIQDRACQRFFKVASWQRYFEVARQNTAANLERKASRKHDFFQAQEDDIQAAERDVAEDADRVHGFEDHVYCLMHRWNASRSRFSSHVDVRERARLHGRLFRPPLAAVVHPWNVSRCRCSETPIA